MHKLFCGEAQYSHAWEAQYSLLTCKAQKRLNGSHECLSPSQRRVRASARDEGTNSPRLFTPGEREALAKSKVHQ
jgi:hypothetical protein